MDDIGGTKRPIAEVFTRAAETYDSVGPKFFSHFGDRLVVKAKVTAGAQVLDVASGTGAVLLPAIRRVGSEGRVIGIDISEGMIKRLEQMVTTHSLAKASLCLMDAEHIGFHAASFDTLLCGFALDSFPNPNRATAEFLRVLRSGGRLALTISSGWWWEGDDRWRWHGELLESLGVDIRSENRRFATRSQVESYLEAANFVDVTVLQEQFELAFADAEEWWRWAWSHGYRRVLESMDRKSLERYEATCFEQLQGRFPGGILGKLEVLLAVATKRNPGSS